MTEYGDDQWSSCPVCGHVRRTVMGGHVMCEHNRFNRDRYDVGLPPMVRCDGSGQRVYEYAEPEAAYA